MRNITTSTQFNDVAIHHVAIPFTVVLYSAFAIFFAIVGLLMIRNNPKLPG